MSQVYFASLDMTAKVALQVVDDGQAPSDRDRDVQALFDYLHHLALVPAHRIVFITVGEANPQRVGVQVTLMADMIRTLLRHLSDRLRHHPLDLRVFLLVGQVRLQVQSRHGEELLTLLPAVDALLPARQLFQARAEAYALRGGEHSPVEQANLELLRYRLDIPPEDAEEIIDRVLGPYLDRQAKLHKYREVLQAELNRGGYPSEATWAELRQLYESLGLSSEDVAVINHDHADHLRVETQHYAPSIDPDLDDGDRLEAEADTEIMEATQPPPSPGSETVAPSASPMSEVEALANYRQEFEAAIAHSLYPSEFDRGRLEQARRFWQLTPEQVQAIEQAVTADRYGPIDSALGLDYTRLRQLLWSQDWRQADQETERLLLTGLSADMRPVDGETFLHLPCVDMVTLDALWRHYSQGRFGFQAQYRVYLQQERRADDFLGTVAWRTQLGVGNLTLHTRPQRYSELIFSLDAPLGHLPTWRWGCDTLDSEYFIPESLVDDLFLHVEKCMPEETLAPVPALEDSL